MEYDLVLLLPWQRLQVLHWGLNIFTPRFIYRIITTQELVSFDFLSANQILVGLFLILLWWILAKGEILGTKANFFLQISVIPLIYPVTLFVSFLNFTIVLIIPLSIIPIFLLIRIVFKDMNKPAMSFMTHHDRGQAI